MRFFFDRNMAPQLARMVDVLEREHIARSYYDDDRFQETDSRCGVDSAHSPPMTRPGLSSAATGDILRNKTELSALKEARLTFFCLSRTWMHMSLYEQAWKFIKTWPQIVENAKGTTPRIYEISGGAGLKVERVPL